MEPEIGKKLQSARKAAKLTQEQAAELLGVSRQTISNWENEKTYPDILCVIRMSDAYHVSLDHLLKGESNMNHYYQYLEESTNVVHSNRRKGQLILTCSYLLIWAVSLLVYWCFTSPSDAMGYSLLFLWLLLPLTTFVTALLIALRNDWGRGKWFAAPILGVLYMLAEFGTFGLGNLLAFPENINLPEPGMFLAGTLIALLALAIGTLVRTLRRKSAPIPET